MGRYIYPPIPILHGVSVDAKLSPTNNFSVIVENNDGGSMDVAAPRST